MKVKKRVKKDRCREAQSRKALSRKAQLSLFFLIGVVMLAVFLMIWYANRRIAGAQLTAPTEKMVTDMLKTGAIPYYVGLCLEKHSEDGLSFIGYQGGDIYRDQFGPAPNPNRFLPLDHRVSYGVMKPLLQNGTLYPYPPGYPGGEGRSQQVPALDFRNFGRFGEVTLRKLCDTFGANRPFLFGQYISAPICLNNIYTDTLASQWQLEKFVAYHIPNCTNWTAIRQETGYNVTPIGDVNVTVRLGLTDIWIDAYIPLKIEVGGVEPVYTVGDFHAREPVRLKRIVELASLMAMYDSYQLDFNMSKQYRIFSAYYDEAMEVTITTPFKAAKIWDDVISIEDRRSLINGKNYVYRFVRENRWPVLDYVGKMGKINWTGFDIVVMENDTIFLNPNPYADSGDPDMNGQKHIYDPDEDELTYYYTGWKSTCSPDDEDWFDFDLGVPRLQCSRLEPSHPSSKFKFPMSTEVLDEEMTNAWMTSEPYLATGRNASYMPSHDDIGPHNVTIWVCDEAGLCDYQIVRIMVVDFPILHFNGTNPYEDISDEKASVEDFYRLSADGTTAYYTPLLGYVFTDGVEPFQVVIDHPLQIWDMPRPPPERARSIAWIHLYNFSQKALNSCGTIPCIHYINLSITSVSIPPEILNVSVYQCLPHMNPTPEGQLMWPYNVTNAFDASHLCCSVGDKVNNSFSYTVTPGPDAKRFSVPRVYKEDLDKVIVYKNGVKFCTKEAENQQQMCGGIKIYIEESMINIDMEKPFSGPDTQNCPPGAMCWVESPGAPAGNYTVEQISTIQRPPWGTYLGRDTTCYGGDPKIGAAQEMEINDIHHPMVENATAMTLGYWDDKWFNDIMAIIFERRCSGWRGNICNGPPMVTYHQVQECPDIDTDKGEIEHCQGPDYRIIEPKTLVETDPDQPCGVDSECLLPPGICNVKKGECYRLPTFYGGDSPYDCKLYGPGESFEKVFNISRKFPLTGLGNGTCNTRATCSDSLDEYDTSVTEGQYVLTAGAECFEGECKKPIAGGVQNCYDDSGWYNKEQGIPFCSKETDHYWTQAAKCVETSGVPECDLIEQRASRIDPDLKQQYCEGCFDPGALPESIYKGQDGGWTGTTCCGDDKGEGGWPYQGAAQRASGATTPEAGAYQATEICDDYYGSHPENPDSWIDNDCDGQYNCQDIGSCSMTTDSQYRNARTNPSQRAGRYGPSKGLCCTTDDQCRNFFFGYTYYYNSITAADTNVECSDINECECTKLDKLPPDYFWQLGLGQSTTTLNLCVAGDTFNGDRSIRLNPGTNTPARWNFEITVSDADNDGVDECQGKVNLIVMKVANNIPMPLGPGGVQVSNILVENPTFLVFTNIHEETCLINLIMTPA